MRRRKQNILLNLLLGTGAYLLYSKRHQLGDIEDLRDRARESYETASRRLAARGGSSFVTAPRTGQQW